ncbi:MAG: dihydroorotase [Prevotellaceae bacterium]|jgi:dihydroorotase|nr:dihydroorotase [Prevotellaceae bacterium]
MKRTLIKNVTIVNEGKQFKGSVSIAGETISDVFTADTSPSAPFYDDVIDGTGCLLLPGVIDDHVHFREPGLTHKADIYSESHAAVAGGVTAIMDMPNTNPPTVTPDALHRKLDLLNERCLVNHSCYFGATNDNHTLFDRIERERVCGIKLFMGSSTGNMLVDRMTALEHIFRNANLPIAAHCENQTIIRRNTERIQRAYPEGAEIPIQKHAYIRSVEACYDSTKLAIRMALDARARLHVLHLSTEKELHLFDSLSPEERSRITAEVCVAHLIFSSHDYDRLGARIKCNPSIKHPRHRAALRKAVNNGLIDVIATDHAPHLPDEKRGGALKAASGMPMIQYALPSMLRLTDEHCFPLTTLVEKMCHAPARLFNIDRRGYIRPGYYADITLVRRGTPWRVTADNVLSKCGWSPLEGKRFEWQVEKTIVNGHIVYDSGQIDHDYRGMELRFHHP